MKKCSKVTFKRVGVLRKARNSYSLWIIPFFDSFEAAMDHSLCSFIDLLYFSKVEKADWWKVCWSKSGFRWTSLRKFPGDKFNPKQFGGVNQELNVVGVTPFIEHVNLLIKSCKLSQELILIFLIFSIFPILWVKNGNFATFIFLNMFYFNQFSWIMN
jgi:hypothetical protein